MINRNVVVGLFVIAGAALFGIGLVVTGEERQAFRKHVDYYTDFSDLDGLTKGSKVQVGGFTAGQIVDIQIPDSPSTPYRVTLRIDRKLHGLIRTDSIATIGTEGIVGDTYLSIRPGSAAAREAGPFSTITSQKPLELSDVLARGSELLDNADATLKDTRVRLDSALDSVNGSLSNINDVVVGLKEGHGVAGMLLKDEAVAGEVRQAIGQTQTITSNLQQVSSQVGSIVSDIQGRRLPQQIDDTVHSVKNAALNIDDSTRQIHQTVAQLSQEDEQGLTLAENVRTSLSNANMATGNLAAETEALKHNFLLRGFFRRRGYFDLDHLSPDKYRKDKFFLKPANSRIWLPASDVFEVSTDGGEVISRAGKQLLSTMLAQLGDAVVEQPIVVEGYAKTSDAVDELAKSRQRAILVRQYLLTQYELELTEVGIVSLRDSPPQEVGRPSWDGICIVVAR